MIKEFDHVRIKSSGVIGDLIDLNGEDCIIETDQKGVPGGLWPEDKDAYSLIPCKLDDLEPI